MGLEGFGLAWYSAPADDLGATHETAPDPGWTAVSSVGIHVVAVAQHKVAHIVKHDTVTS